MSYKVLSIITLLFLAYFQYIKAQTPTTFDIGFEQSWQWLAERSSSIKIARMTTQSVKEEQGRVQSFWYPRLSLSGGYVHLSNDIEVRQSLSTLTNPIKEMVGQLLPNSQVINGLLDQIGSQTLVFPLMRQNMTTIDAQIIWPLFTGGKRLFASRIGENILSVSEVEQRQVFAQSSVQLVETYFGLRLGQEILHVREQNLQTMQQHYRQAVLLESQGMINKAERLLIQVNLEEAKREVESAKNEHMVVQQALKNVLNIGQDTLLVPISPLFINMEIPSVLYFKSLLPSTNYKLEQLRLQQKIVSDRLKINQSGYFPEIVMIGKQTLYSHNVNKYLLPRTMIGVGFTWTLFDGLDRERSVRQAKIEQQTLIELHRKAKGDLDVGIEKFYTQIKNSLDQIHSLKSSIQMSEELLRMRRKMFDQQMATSAEVMDAQLLYSKVQVAVLLTYYQYDLALINTFFLCGIPQEFESFRQGTPLEKESIFE